MKDKKFAYFQQKILEHLERLEAKELRSIKKSLREAETLVKAGLPVGTIRTWKGKKFIKIAPNKWKPKYDGESRGAKMAIAALKKKAQSCTDSKQLMQLVLENRSRFSDDSGRPLPFVQELSDYISELTDKVERGKEMGQQIDKINARQLKRIKALRKKGYTDEQIDNDHVIKQTKQAMRDLDKPENQSKRKVRITFNKKKLGAKPAAMKDGDGNDAKQKERLKQISEILQKNIEPMPEKIDFTRDNFDKLFKNGIESPIEHIKIGEHQFEKLEEKGRQGLLAPMADVMKNPALVIKTADGAKLYVKTYKNKKNAKNIVSVIVDKGDIHVSISTHIERDFQLAKKNGFNSF